MGLLYCAIAILLGFLFARVYIAANMKAKVAVLILLPIILNLCISLFAALFVGNSLEYGYSVGSIAGILFPATLAMMVVLGFRIDLKKNIMEKQHESNDGVEAQKTMTEVPKKSLYSINSTGWDKKMIILALIIIAFLFALNGRYSYLEGGIIMDKWSGRAYYIDKILDE